MLFGGMLKELRLKANFTQAKLAKASGLATAYLSNMENDRVPPPALARVALIAAALNLKGHDATGLFAAWAGYKQVCVLAPLGNNASARRAGPLLMRLWPRIIEDPVAVEKLITWLEKIEASVDDTAG